MKLRTKFGLILLLIMLVLGGVVLGSTEWFKQNTIQQERDDVRETANLTSKQITRTLSEKKDTVRRFAKRSELGADGDKQAILREFIRQTDFRTAALIDRNGTLTSISGDMMTQAEQQDRVGTNVSGQRYYNNTVLGGNYEELLPPSQVANSDNPMILFSSATLYGPDGTPEGIFLALLPLDPTTIDSWNVQRQGFVFPSIPPQERQGQSLRVTGRNPTSGENVTIHRPEQTFENQFEATHERTELFLDVTVYRNKAALSKRLGRLQQIQFAGLLVVLGSILSLGYWEYSTNLTQTGKLLDGFAELQTGNFDYDLSLTAAEEWQQISNGFNQMSSGLREREQGIREREQRLGVLNRVLRHNLQNDMSVILTYAEMLPELGDDEQDDAIETILEKGNGLVAHGKKARQIEEAMESAEEGLIEQDLSTLVEEVLADLESEFPDATIENDLPEEVQVAAITSIGDAIESIAENALEHTDSDDPRVTVSVERDDAFVRLLVADNGPGIPEYEQEVVSSAEETDLEHGSGLGLFLATWVLEKSGGDIEFETPEDGGTTALLFIPTADQAGTEASSTVTV